MSASQSSLHDRLSEDLILVDVLTRSARAPGTLGEAVAYVLERPGKRIRPRLCLSLAKSLELPHAQCIGLAAAVELLHIASLVLDDVQDNDEMRRGRASVWRKFGRASAINVGAYFIAESFALAARLPGVSPIFAAALRAATIGQSAEVDFFADIPTLAAYNAVAVAKTGALFALPAQGAAVLANFTNDVVESIGKAFALLGAAYQIQDDLADAFGRKGRARAGLDLREGKANSIVLCHLSLKPSDGTAFLAFQRDRSARASGAQLDAWLDRLFASNSVALAGEHLRELCGEIVIASRSIPAPFASQLSALATEMREDVASLRGTSEVFSECAL